MINVKEHPNYDHYYLELPRVKSPLDNMYVVGFMFNVAKTDVLLIKKNRPEWQVGMYNGVGGKIDHDEFIRDAMVREFWEETGIKTKGEDWYHVFTVEGKAWRVWFFTTFTDKVYNYDNTTDEVLRIVPVNQINALPLIGNLYWMIPLAKDETVVFPLMIEDTVP